MTVPYIVAGALGLSTLAMAVHLGGAPEPFALSSAIVVAVGIVLFSVIAASGLLINRGRWSRVVSIVVAAAILVLAAVTEPGPWSILAVAASLVALFGLTGRWLSGWLRPRPSATGPGTKVVSLLLGTVALVPAVGIASPAGLETGHGILGAAGVLLAWGYSKAHQWALWGLRLVLPFVAIPAIVSSPPAGALLLAGQVGVLTGLAWTREARIAVSPVYDEPPGPRRGSPRSSGRSST